MRDEQIMILTMLHNHTISSEDAGRLLGAIGTRNVDQDAVQSVLREVDLGTTSPEEAVNRLTMPPTRLTPSVVESSASASKSPPPAPAQWVRIRVEQDGKTQVNVRLPFGLINAGVGLASGISATFNGHPIQNQLDDLWDVIRQSPTGKVIEVDGEKGERIEITVE